MVLSTVGSFAMCLGDSEKAIEVERASSWGGFWIDAKIEYFNLCLDLVLAERLP